jgi:hypothetical protein
MYASSQSITFPSPYISKPIVIVTGYSSATSGIWVSSITATTFQVTAGGAGTFEWMSIGI